MSDASRPWWATPDGVDALGDEDPVDAHRRARRGTVPGTDRAYDDLGDEPSDLGDEPSDGGHDGRAAVHDPDVCGVCPWCSGLRLLAASHPETVAHLTEAARHLTQAVRGLVADLQRPGDGDDGRDDDPLQRIDLD